MFVGLQDTALTIKVKAEMVKAKVIAKAGVKASQGETDMEKIQDEIAREMSRGTGADLTDCKEIVLAILRECPGEGINSKGG